MARSNVLDAGERMHDMEYAPAAGALIHFSTCWCRRKEPKVAYETKDSGERAEYDGGMVRDSNAGKPRFDLCSPLDVPYGEQLLTRWAALMGRGAEKYGDRNWEKGRGEEVYQRAKESAFRHFLQWYFDEEDEDHASAVLFNISAAEYFKERQ